ncbi:hypothetical protein BLNAU_4157 [Blattamonas nauphoetae]|uniref:Uncharacterized protein n=1 Tax=Blattamonas nauphoetae TaxID=2049346 RepID=A0ABQ9YAH0_9EUKA|nr:hypothetical protein BLNAU_4157 [Blattamonas nauphoetae]
MKLHVHLMPNHSTIDVECDDTETIYDLKKRICQTHFKYHLAANPGSDETCVILFYKPGVSIGQVRPETLVSKCGAQEGDTLQWDFEESSVQLEMKQQKAERPPTD